MVLCILVNTLLLALDRYPDDPEETKVMEKINIFFTAIFTVEVVIKLLAIGFKHYFKSMFNLFDCLVVISGLIDIFLAAYLLKD
jgi:Ion transport protein